MIGQFTSPGTRRAGGSEPGVASQPRAARDRAAPGWASCSVFAGNARVKIEESSDLVAIRIWTIIIEL